MIAAPSLPAGIMNVICGDRNFLQGVRSSRDPTPRIIRITGGVPRGPEEVAAPAPQT